MLWFDFMHSKEYRDLCASFVRFFAGKDLSWEGVANAFIEDGNLMVYYDTYDYHRPYGQRAGYWYTYPVDPNELDGYTDRIYPTGISPVQVERRRLGIDRPILFPKGAQVIYRHFAPVTGKGDEYLVAYGDKGLVIEASDDENGMVDVDFAGRVMSLHASTIANGAEWSLYECCVKPWQAVDYEADAGLRWRESLPLPEFGNEEAVAG